MFLLKTNFFQKDIINTTRGHSIELVLLIFITGFYILNYIYMTRELPNFTHETMSAQHSHLVKVYYQYLKTLNLSELITMTRKTHGPGMAPYNLGAAVSLLIFGKDWHWMVLSNNTFYFLILLVFTYLLGRTLKDAVTGRIGALLVALYPLIYSIYRGYFIDFPLTAITVMSVYLLIKSDFFHNRKWSLLLGISLVWGLMLRFTFGLFIAGPVIYGLWKVWLSIRNKDFGPVFNLIICLGLVLIIISPFYCYVESAPGTNMNIFIYELTFERTGIKWYSFENLRLFTTGIWQNQLTPPFFIFFIAGCVYLFKNKSSIIKPLLLWIIIPNLVLIFIDRPKTVRYLVPVMPAYAIITALWLGAIFKKSWGKVILVSVILIGIIQYYVFIYERGFKLSQYKWYYEKSHDIGNTYPEIKRKSQICAAVAKKFVDKVKKLKEKGRIKEQYLILIPISSYAGEVLELVLSDLLWFYDISADCIVSNYFGIDGLEEAYRYSDDIDFMLYIRQKETRAKPWLTKRKFEEREPFLEEDSYLEYAQEYWQWQEKRNRVEMIPEGYNWQEGKKKWDKILNHFKTKEMIYENEELIVYLYSSI